jgi:hypothetical protein
LRPFDRRVGGGVSGRRTLKVSFVAAGEWHRRFQKETARVGSASRSRLDVTLKLAQRQLGHPAFNIGAQPHRLAARFAGAADTTARESACAHPCPNGWVSHARDGEDLMPIEKSRRANQIAGALWRDWLSKMLLRLFGRLSAARMLDCFRGHGDLPMKCLPGEPEQAFLFGVSEGLSFHLVRLRDALRFAGNSVECLTLVFRVALRAFVAARGTAGREATGRQCF